MNGRPWSPKELERLRKLYPERAARKVAKMLRRPLCSVYSAAYALGLKKTEEF
jgi:hypothetical protein